MRPLKVMVGMLQLEGRPLRISLLWLLLPHILMNLDRHTLGYAGSLLSLVLLSPYICTYWWRGGHVGLAPLGNALACSVILLDPHTLHIFYNNVYQILCQCNLYIVISLFCSVHSTSLACLSVLGEGSLLHGSSWGFFKFFTLLKAFCFCLLNMASFSTLESRV